MICGGRWCARCKPRLLLSGGGDFQWIRVGTGGIYAPTLFSQHCGHRVAGYIHLLDAAEGDACDTRKGDLQVASHRERCIEKGKSRHGSGAIWEWKDVPG